MVFWYNQTPFPEMADVSLLVDKRSRPFSFIVAYMIYKGRVMSSEHIIKGTTAKNLGSRKWDQMSDNSVGKSNSPQFKVFCVCVTVTI